MRGGTVIVSDMDLLGADGGRIAAAFASGWAACMALCTALGAFLWSQLGKAKDEQIASLKAQMEANEARCGETVAALSNRVVQLETMLWMHGPQQIRAQVQAVVSEQHLEMRSKLLDASGEKESGR